MTKWRCLLRPWSSFPLQSLFQWIALLLSLALLDLLLHILLYGHFQLPSGVIPRAGYYTLGAADSRGAMTPMALLQVQMLEDRLGSQLGNHSLYAELDIQLQVGKTPASQYRVAVLQQNFYHHLGLRIHRGRFFSSNPGQLNQELMISHALWNRLGHPEDPSTIHVRLGKQNEWTVVGVLPPHFTGFGVQPVDFWLPPTLLPDGLLRLNTSSDTEPELMQLTLRFAKRVPYYHLLGILENSENLATLMQQAQAVDLALPPMMTSHGPVIINGLEENNRALLSPGLNTSPKLWEKTRHYTQLLAVVALDLLVLSSFSLLLFLLEQLPVRQDEFRLRHIFGATLGKLGWQIFRENLGFVLSVLPLAWLLSRLLFAQLAEITPFSHFIPERLQPPGPALLAWSALVALLLAALLTALPLWALSKRLRPRSGQNSADITEGYLASLFNSLQLTTATAALFIALLFAFNLYRISTNSNKGGEQVHLLNWQCADEDKNCDLLELMALNNEQILSQLAPGAEAAGTGEPLFSPLLDQRDIRLEPMMKTGGGGGRYQLASAHFDRGWLQALNIRLSAGRWPQLSSEILVNNAFLRLQGLSADQILGRQYRQNGARQFTYRVTGVLEDYSLEDPRKPALPRIIFTETASSGTPLRNEIAWKGNMEEKELLRRLRQALNQQGADRLTIRHETLAMRVHKRLSGEQHYAWLIGGSSILTLFLALAGLYASTRHSLKRQNRVLGIHLAYGAHPTHLAVLVISQRMLMLAGAILVAFFVLGMMAPLIDNWLLPLRPWLLPLLAAGLLLILTGAILATVLALRSLWHREPMELIRDG